ncbi:protein YgfX [Sulfurifustis variabilis]|uniref:protein YgfX n=1 Tax=Sulfurifustis variabilis TaxID=1675686 RepID=UPI0011E4D21F|nr:protein YgfX [Sulfurifustis variabilis]
MSARFGASLTIVLGPSHRLAGLLGIAYGGAIAIALLLPVPWLVRGAIALVLAFGLYLALRTHAYRSTAGTVNALEFGADGTCSVRFSGAGQWTECELEHSWVHPRLALLSLRVAGARRARVAIAADAIPAEAFRRLRVRLRLRTAAE